MKKLKCIHIKNIKIDNAKYYEIEHRKSCARCQGKSITKTIICGICNVYYIFKKRIV